MNPPNSPQWIAFAAHARIAAGEPAEVAAQVKRFVDARPEASVIVLNADSSRPIDLDLRGTVEAVVQRLVAPAAAAPESGEPSPAVPQGAARGPGRPRLGVVPREVTLLPRHWDWLGAQPGGASVALRKLVEQALRANAAADRRREATESAYRFMHVLAGNLAGFEEASRALFAGDAARLEHEIAGWPADVREHLRALAGRAAHEPPASGAPEGSGAPDASGRSAPTATDGHAPADRPIPSKAP
jgi:hypothetical protein